MADHLANQRGRLGITHIRLSLRLLLLVVALFAVVFAYVGVNAKLRRDKVRWEINRLEANRDYPTSSEQDRQRLQNEIDAAIAKLRQENGIE